MWCVDRSVAFECFDSDGSGSIDQSEFHGLMKVLAAQHPEIPVPTRSVLLCAVLCCAVRCCAVLSGVRCAGVQIKAIEAFDGDNDGNIDFSACHAPAPAPLPPCPSARRRVTGVA